jgi:hypothetical protein
VSELTWRWLAFWQLDFNVCMSLIDTMAPSLRAGVNKETVFGSMSGGKQKMSHFKVVILCRF